VGDCIEFRTQPGSSGIITNMIDNTGVDRPWVYKHEQKEICRVIIRQVSDGKFAVWDPTDFPSDFLITFNPSRYLA
jgi:hypothetical protein